MSDTTSEVPEEPPQEREPSGLLSRPGVKRLNRKPMYLTLAVGGIVLFIFLLAIIQRTTGPQRTAVDGGGTERQTTDDVVTTLTDGRPDGIIPAEAPVLQPRQNDADPRPVPPEVVEFDPDSPLITEETTTDPLAELEKQAEIRMLEYEIDKEFQELQLRDRMAQEARNSVTNLGLQGLGNTLDGGAARANGTQPANPVSQLAALTEQLQGLQQPGGRNAPVVNPLAGLGALAGGQQQDPNGQANKQSFLNNAGEDEDYLQRRLQEPVSPFEVKQGTVIPGLMVTGINSDLPGRIVGQVSQNVYDTATGQHLLIPQGTRIFGRYDSSVTFGQSRVLVAWTRLIFPDGTAINIEAMAGADQAGRGGFRDRVNNHLFRIYGNAILLSVIGGGIEALRDGGGQDDELADAIRENFGDTFNQVVQQTIQRNLDIQPTLEIRPGYRFVILVDRDMVLRPYRPVN